jgi:hypothetical protein
MPGILFTNFWMLAGLVALSVPVIIHLLLRRKKKRVRFSTIQFFMRQDEQASQRRKLRNWFLLALRLLICTLLVLAFARPYLRSGAIGAAGDRKRQAIVLLDRSLSMQANSAEGPKWSRAVSAARQILAGLKPDDRAALISCASHAEVLAEWAPPAVVGKRLNDLQPTCETGSLVEGIRQAARMMKSSDPKAATTIYVVSDLQRSGCQNLASCPLPLETELKIVRVGDLVTPNLTVSDLQLDPQGGLKPYATLTSFSDEDNSEVKFELRVDGATAASGATVLGAGASTNVELTLPVFKPGWHNVEFKLRGHDALALDDSRIQSIFVPEPAHVLVCESHGNNRIFEQESFFVRAALNPSEGSTNAVQTGFACETVGPDELATRIAAAGNEKASDLVIVPGLKQIPSALGTALVNYVEKGGGLLLFLGDEVSANRYNAEFRQLLPVQLGKVELSPETEMGWRMGEYQTNTPVFGAFQVPNSGDLSLAHFLGRFTFAEAPVGNIAARFEDGLPLVVARELGHGRVVLVNTSADTHWTDWPKHKTFVPWLYGTAQYLAARMRNQQEHVRSNLLAGMEVELELGAASAKGQFQFIPPNGKAVPVTADDQGQLRNLAFPTPGIYSVRDANGREIRRLAVNVSSQESDLTALAASDFQQQVTRASESRQNTLAAGLFGSESNHQELWRVLLLGAVLLLFLEMLVANRTLA